MQKMRHMALIVLVAALMAQPLQARAQGSGPGTGLDEQTPKELLEGAARMMMEALELMIKTVPQYEAPVILDNGAILIRRKRAPEGEGGEGGGDGDDPGAKRI